MKSTSTRNQGPMALRNAAGYIRDGVDMVGRAPGSFCQRASICAAISLAAGMLLGGPLPAVAQGVDLNCDPEAVGAVRDSVADGIADPDVSFVVGYSVETGAGPVICINVDEVGIDGPLTEADSIPEDAAQNVDILAVEEAFFVRYQLNRDNGRIEKRFCHSVGVEDHLDCFIIFSVLAPPDDPNGPPSDDLRRVRVFISDADLANELGVEPGTSVLASIGIASGVCAEGAPELARRIRVDGEAACEAVRITEAFRNLVQG